MTAEAGGRLFHAVSRRLITASWIANGMGAAAVFMSIGFLIAAIYDADQRDALGRDNLPLVVGCVVVLGLFFTWIAGRERRRAMAWLMEGREPTAEESRRTLRLPTFAAILTAIGWTVAVFAGFFFNLDHSLGVAATTGAALWIGAEITSAIAFLITERTLRPVTAMVLANYEPKRFTAPNVRQRLLAAWSFGTGAPLLSVLAVGIIGVTNDNANPESIAAACIYLGGVAFVLGYMVTMISARAISDPLASMRTALEKIAEGDLGVRVDIDDASEVGRLQAGFNRMAEGLEERERIRDLFGRQVGEEVARAALLDGTTKLGGEEREIGALFVDLTGSTSMALAMPPTHVVRLLNKFFRVVIEVVESEGGFVNKFEGDAALCVFGAPIKSEDPSGHALCAARLMAERLEREVPEVGFGIGVSAGPAVAGNVGSEQRFEYTVIGDPVNEAARLSDLAKERQVHVVASDAALDRASPIEAEEWERGERTVLRGRLEATVLASPRA